MRAFVAVGRVRAQNSPSPRKTVCAIIVLGPPKFDEKQPLGSTRRYCAIVLRNFWGLGMDPKLPQNEVSMVSVLGIVMIVWGIYCMLGQLDP